MINDQTKLEQLMACKIALNLHREAEELFNQKARNDNGDLRYYLGVSFVAQNKYEESLTELLSLIKDNPNHQLAKSLAFRLLIRKAHQKARDKNFVDIASILSMAVELAPDTSDARKELAFFKNFLPISNIRVGKRDDAAKLWEEELRRHPTDHRLIHNLALLYYWWALDEERKIIASESNDDSPRPEKLWEKSISYWIVLLNMQSFWSEWKKEKEAIWNLEIVPNDLEEFRDAFLEEKFIGIFRNYIALYKQNGKDQDALRHDNYLLTLLLEKESALKWKEVYEILNVWKDDLNVNLNGVKRYELIRALQMAEGKNPCFGAVKDCNKNTDECLWCKTCQSDRNRELCFNLPAGRKFFQDSDILTEVNKLIELLDKTQPNNESIGKLRFYLHPAGLGRVLMLLEQRKNPYCALAELKKLSDEKLINTDSVDVVYLYALAHIENGRLIYKEENKFDKALVEWTHALGLVIKAKTLMNLEDKPGYKGRLIERLIESLGDTLEDLIVKGCEKEAKKHKQADRIDDAIVTLLDGIKLIDGMKSINCSANKSLSDLIALFYCDRGTKKLNEERFSDARKDYEEALKHLPGYGRANEGLSTAYNNEGVSKNNAAQAIPLFEKAIEFNENNQVANQNLAGAYNGYAVEKLNAISQYSPLQNRERCNDAIELLKKAIRILNPNLQESAILAVLAAGDSIEVIVNGLEESVYKTALRNLAVAGKYLKALRGY